VTVLPTIAQGAVLGLASAAAPGPFQALLVARSLRAGPVRALPLAFVPLTSDPVVIAVVLALLSQFPPRFLTALSAVGAAVVFWLAVATLRTAARGSASAPGSRGGSPGFLSAVALNVTNPNAWIFWSAVGGPLLATAWRSSPAAAVGFLAAFYACITAGNAALALAAGAIARAGPRAARALGVLSGVALLGFGAWQLLRLFRR
jgi:threonine/homoserine/homoserine lactone efflux protein